MKPSTVSAPSEPGGKGARNPKPSTVSAKSDQGGKGKFKLKPSTVSKKRDQDGKGKHRRWFPKFLFLPREGAWEPLGALGVSGSFWESLGASGSFWEPLGVSRSLWEPWGASGLFTIGRLDCLISKNLGFRVIVFNARQACGWASSALPKPVPS